MDINKNWEKQDKEEKESWEKEFDNLWGSYEILNKAYEGKMSIAIELKEFIKILLAEQKEKEYLRGFNEGRERFSNMGVSGWKNWGIEKGYWDYFKQEVIDEYLKSEEFSAKESKTHYNHATLEDIKRINLLKKN